MYAYICRFIDCVYVMYMDVRRLVCMYMEVHRHVCMYIEVRRLLCMHMDIHGPVCVCSLHGSLCEINCNYERKKLVQAQRKSHNCQHLKLSGSPLDLARGQLYI